ncbi:MAG TPA: cyclodeaminase/cyclohydrolase family protein [Acidimicrobiia bacterium]|nr:cyclodeaminase/cyclohydrolase family protein [Acidimicrobiia bacterium]
MHPTSLRGETLERFLERLASTDPAPGGGGSAAIATAMAAALVEMAAGLSTDHVADAADIGAAAGDIRRRALTLADDDATAYGRVIAAYRLPRDNDGDPDARRREIREALEGATAVPLEIAGLAADAARLGSQLVAGGNPDLEGDAAAAVLLARAAARAAARLVELNVEQGKLGGDWCDRAAAAVTRAETDRPSPH